MALTAFPTISINASTGSDTLSSGDGGVSCTGTATSVSSTTITLTIATGTLTGVATDGTAVIWISGVGFVRIDTVDTGAGTIVVETAVTCTDANFAIGGKRASLDGTETRRLFAATSSPTASGMSGRWIISLEDNQTISSALVLAATSGTGSCEIKSNTPGTMRTITQSASATHFSAGVANKWRFTDLKFLNSNGTPLEVVTVNTAIPILEFHRCLCGDSGGTNCPKGLYIRTSASAYLYLYDTSVLRCTSIGINGTCNILQMFGSEISRCGGAGISGAIGNGSLIKDSIISYNTGDGVNTSQQLSFTVLNSVFHGNTGDGFECSANNALTGYFINNQFTANGGYGLRMSGTQPHTVVVEYNNFGNASDSTSNTSGTATGITLSSTNTTAASAYTDASNSVRNFKVGAACQGTGFPPSSATVAAGQTGTTAYSDQGLPTHAVSAGGGVGKIITSGLVR